VHDDCEIGKTDGRDKKLIDDITCVFLTQDVIIPYPVKLQPLNHDIIHAVSNFVQEKVNCLATLARYRPLACHASTSHSLDEPGFDVHVRLGLK
jgi:hypothetical protein